MAAMRRLKKKVRVWRREYLVQEMDYRCLGGKIHRHKKMLLGLKRAKKKNKARLCNKVDQ